MGSNRSINRMLRTAYFRRYTLGDRFRKIAEMVGGQVFQQRSNAAQHFVMRAAKAAARM